MKGRTAVRPPKTTRIKSETVKRFLAAALAAVLLTTGIGNRYRDGVTAMGVGKLYPYPDIPFPQALMGSQALAPHLSTEAHATDSADRKNDALFRVKARSFVPIRLAFEPERLDKAGIYKRHLFRALTGQEIIKEELFESILDELIGLHTPSLTKNLPKRQQELFFLTVEVASARYPIQQISLLAGFAQTSLRIYLRRRHIKTQQRAKFLEGLRKAREGLSSPVPPRRVSDGNLRVSLRLLKESVTLSLAPHFSKPDSAIDWLIDNRPQIRREILASRQIEDENAEILHRSFLPYCLTALSAEGKIPYNAFGLGQAADYALRRKELIQEKLREIWSNLVVKGAKAQLLAIKHRPNSITYQIKDRSFLTHLNRPTKSIYPNQASHVLRYAMKFYGKDLIQELANAWIPMQNPDRKSRTEDGMDRAVENALKVRINPLHAKLYKEEQDALKNDLYNIYMVDAKRRSRAKAGHPPKEPLRYNSWSARVEAARRRLAEGGA